MKLLILSDIHLEFDEFVVPTTDADVVVLAGDIHHRTRGVRWARDAFGELPVVYVPGNHEFYGASTPRLLGKMRRAAAGSNVHVLQDEAVTLAGVRFLGCTLWTDFALHGDRSHRQTSMRICGQLMNDYRCIRRSRGRRELRPSDTWDMHSRSVHWLREQLSAPSESGDPTVVVTHHAPSLQSVPQELQDDPVSSAFASDLDGLVSDSGAPLWIHGHLHRSHSYRLGDTEVVCNARGYPSEPANGFDPGLVFEV